MFNKVISFSLLNYLTLVRCYKSSSSLSPKVRYFVNDCMNTLRSSPSSSTTNFLIKGMVTVLMIST